MGSFAVSSLTNAISGAVLPKLRPLDDYRLTKSSAVLFFIPTSSGVFGVEFCLLKKLGRTAPEMGLLSSQLPTGRLSSLSFLIVFR